MTKMIGVEQRPDGRLGIISEWMDNGSLSRYLGAHKKDSVLNRLQLVSFCTMRFIFPLIMTRARSWTFARDCSTCTHNESPTLISKAYVRCILGVVLQFLSLCLHLQENILIDKNGRANLCDSGMPALMLRIRTCVPPQGPSSSAGTPYLAPEFVDPQRYMLPYYHAPLSTDIYALGIVMWQV